MCQLIYHGHCCERKRKFIIKTHDLLRDPVTQFITTPQSALWRHTVVTKNEWYSAVQPQTKLTSSFRHIYEAWNSESTTATKVGHANIHKILTQFQGRSRIPEGTSQRLGGCSGLTKHKSKLQSGDLAEALMKQTSNGKFKRNAERVQHSRCIERPLNCRIQVLKNRTIRLLETPSYCIPYPV